MTPQVTNRRDGGLTTCHGHSRKFCDLERARLREQLRNCLWREGVRRQGVVVEGVKGVE
jgi:hypothetical protein